MTAVGGGGALLAVGVLAREQYALLMQEDGPVEWTTCWAFVGAAMVLLLTAVRAGGTATRAERWLPVALAVFCLFVAGEEISWGQRLIGYQPAELFLARNYQQESNLHNLLKGHWDSRWQVFFVAVGYGVIAPLAGRRGWLPNPWAPTTALIPGGLLVSLVELFYPLDLSGEVAEVVLGGVFLHDALVRHGRWVPVRGHLIMLACVGLGAVTPPLLDRTLYRADEATVAVARAELQQLAAEVASGTTARLQRRARVHKRLYTAATVGYLRAPAPAGHPTGSHADDRRNRYYLDPWQQPYWILAVRRGDHTVVLLYSFGPNRRRDTPLEDVAMVGSGLRGDDLGVVVVIPQSRQPDAVSR